MYPANFTRVQNEDLGPNPPKSLTPVVDQLNLIIQYLQTAFANGITIQANLATPVIIKQTVVSGQAPNDAISFLVPLPQSYQPQGVIIINCIDNSGALVGNVVGCEMTPGLQNGNVAVGAIYGLTATHSYTITFLVF